MKSAGQRQTGARFERTIVPFCARELSAASGVLARRSVPQVRALIGSYERQRIGAGARCSASAIAAEIVECPPPSTHVVSRSEG
jgi:hypothetical protein